MVCRAAMTPLKAAVGYLCAVPGLLKAAADHSAVLPFAVEVHAV